MKKQFLLLAGAAVLFASCGSNGSKTETPSQSQVDSTVNAKLQEHDAANAAKNDSMVNAKAKEEAAAMAKEKEKKGGGHEHTKAAPASPAPTPTVAPTPAPAAGGLRGHSDQSQSGATNTTAKPSGGGLRSHSDQSQGGK